MAKIHDRDGLSQRLIEDDVPRRQIIARLASSILPGFLAANPEAARAYVLATKFSTEARQIAVAQIEAMVMASIEVADEVIMEVDEKSDADIYGYVDRCFGDDAEEDPRA